MGTNFRNDIPDYFFPPWWTGPFVRAMWSSFGAQMDAVSAQVLWSRLQAVPFAGGANAGRVGAARLADGRLLECEPFVLPILAAQRGMPMYPTEPTLGARQRLAQFRPLHAQRGTDRGKLNHARPYFSTTYPWMRIVFQTGSGIAVWWTIDPSGNVSVYAQPSSNWNWDGQTSKHSRWWAIVYLPAGYSPGTDWDGGPDWDSTPIWDGIPAAVLADLWQMFYDWKGAGTWFAGLIMTRLQPTDDIPGSPGRHPFDPTDTPFTLSDGHSLSLPDGFWGSPVYLSGANIGRSTRPPWALFYRINNG